MPGTRRNPPADRPPLGTSCHAHAGSHIARKYSGCPTKGRPSHAITAPAVVAQVRVVMGKEPDEFLALFRGRMVVHQGGVASGFKNKNDSDSFDTDGVSLFQVCSYSSYRS